MIDETRLAEIKKRLKSNADGDLQYLLEQVETLQKKNEVLAQHVLELTQEMENTKSDFGNSR